MKHLLFATAALIAAASIGSTALAQSADSSSGSTSISGAQQSLFNGGSSANNGGLSVGDTTSRSNSESGSISGAVSGSSSEGGNAASGATATGGTSNATTGASTANASNAASNAGNAQSITFNSASPSSVRTVPTIYAPGLTTTLTETCMGSTSAGASVLGGGLTIGTTWRDPACMRRLNARELAQTLGDREAARAVLCGDADVADAYERLGRPCPKSPNYRPELAASYIPQPPVQAEAMRAQEPRPPVAPDYRQAPAASMEPIPNPDEGYREPRH